MEALVTLCPSFPSGTYGLTLEIALFAVSLLRGSRLGASSWSFCSLPEERWHVGATHTPDRINAGTEDTGESSR